MTTGKDISGLFLNFYQQKTKRILNKKVPYELSRTT